MLKYKTIDGGKVISNANLSADVQNKRNPLDATMCGSGRQDVATILQLTYFINKLKFNYYGKEA
ncbi:MAG: hypothetical protein IKP73_03280 [Bacteroidales bacterium]|nr:hypothetical protein [Bacteroidales bacterium]